MRHVSGRHRLLNTCGFVRRCAWLVALILLLAPALAPAKPTTSDQARHAVQGWLSLDPTPMGRALQPRVAQAKPARDKATGEVLYHVIDLSPAGYVVVAGDDLIEPIIAFSAAGHYDPSGANPLVTLLQRDLPRRLKAVKDRQQAAAGKGRPFVATGGMDLARGRWQKLTTAATPGALTTHLPGLSDVRVAPFVQSRWDQVDVAGKACYNYYTPPGSAGAASNYPDGCVATAMAQLMRYYQYPTAGVGTAAFPITVGGAVRQARLRGGNGSGGPYAWASMPLAPASSITTAQCQAIGALCYDAGVAVKMAYDSLDNGGSGAYPDDEKAALVNVFKYSNAVLGAASGTSSIPVGYKAMANPNLDAGYPVLLAIYGNQGGHAIVCDGYGYNSSTMYHHLNLGWSGSYDAWYNLPDIDAASYSFTDVGYCIYNIYTSGTGEIVSGRITSTAGIPVAGATVTATRSAGGTYTATTNANGIYALRKIPASSTYAIKAAKSGYVFSASQAVSIGKSADNSAATGNVWGINFTGDLGSGPMLTVLSAAGFSAAGNPGGPFSPASITYTLTNSGNAAMTWSVAKTPGWVNLSKTGGTLAAGAHDTFIVSVNAGANTLGIGSYSGTVNFKNATNGFGNTSRALALTVRNPSAWVLANGNAPWEARDGHAAAVFGGKLWILGGWGANRLNDVWSSGDGAAWTRVTAAATWSPRDSHAVVALNNKLYLMGGGDDTRNFADVWASSNGAAWTRLTAAAPWGPRTGMGAVAFNGRLWVIGGAGDKEMNDVWSSADGMTWTKALAAAPWTARAFHRCEVLGGRIYLMGGYGGAGALHDVWSSADGVTWTQATASAAWPGRYYLASAVMNGKLWILGGFDGANNHFNDVWCSANGVTWTQSATAVPWTKRDSFPATVFLNRLYVMGGYLGGNSDANDAWYLPAATTAAAMSVTPATGLTVSGLPGGPFLASAGYTIKNTGSVTLAWSAAKSKSWVTLSKTSGSLAPGASDKVLVSCNNSGANALAAGVYSDTVTFTNAINGAGNTTRAVSLTVSAGLGAWTRATSAAAWPARYGHSLVAFNNKLWLLGGSGSSTGIWSSADGVSWSRLTTNGPLNRSWMGVTVLNGKLWVMGGMSGGGTLYRDVWSSTNGTSWVRVTSGAPWTARYGHQAAAFGGKLWVLGGTGGSGLLRDVWSSGNGVNWTRVTATAGWAGMTNFASFVFAGRLWVLGDGVAGTEVWASSDGASWIRKAVIGGMGGRYSFSSANYKGRLWAIGGIDYADATSNKLRKDVWSSSDGVKWTRSTATVPWSARYGQASAVFNNRIWLTGGNTSASGSALVHDVWKFAY